RDPAPGRRSALLPHARPHRRDARRGVVHLGGRAAAAARRDLDPGGPRRMTQRVIHVTRDLPPAARGGLSWAVEGLTAALAAVGEELAIVSCDDWRPTRGPRPGGAPPPTR